MFMPTNNIHCEIVQHIAKGDYELDHGGGTGSCPPGWKGWQRLTRLMAIQLPLRAPCLSTASLAYWEQVGVNLHWLPMKGDKAN